MSPAGARMDACARRAEPGLEGRVYERGRPTAFCFHEPMSERRPHRRARRRAIAIGRPGDVGLIYYRAEVEK
jgi:hypothetical protein